LKTIAGYVSLLLALMLPIGAFAQGSDQADYDRIKSDNAYLCGEAADEDPVRARDQADKDLLSKIVVFLRIETTTGTVATDSGGAEIIISEYQRRCKSLTLMYLKGLEHYQVKERKMWSALAFIHRDSLASSMRLRASRIQEFYRQGLAAAAEGRLGESLRNYYWGWLLAQFFPETLEMTLPNGDVSTCPKEAFTKLINSALMDLEIVSRECYQEDSIIFADLTFRYQGKPVRELTFTYYGGSQGMEYNTVDDEGCARLRIFDRPKDRFRKQILTIEYKGEAQMDRDEEISELNGMASENPFDSQKGVELEFPWLEVGGKRMEDQAQDSLVAVNPPVIESSNPLLSQALEALRESLSYAEFQTLVQQYVKLGVIVLGRPEDFAYSSDYYVEVLDNQKTLDLFHFNGDQYVSLRTGKSCSDPTDEYPEENQLWFREKD
jgi:hypothetical protein